jgi:hypothetical protein
MGSPIPVPLSLVAKNALKISSPCSGGNPTPLSLTEISSWLSLVSDLMASSLLQHFQIAETVAELQSLRDPLHFRGDKSTGDAGFGTK